MKVADMTWSEFLALLVSFGLEWNGAADRGTVKHRATGHVVLRDVCPRTNRAYGYPRSSYRRPAHARSYQHDVAINLQDLTVQEIEELMPALGVPTLRAGRRATIRRPCPA